MRYSQEAHTTKHNTRPTHEERNVHYLCDQKYLELIFNKVCQILCSQNDTGKALMFTHINSSIEKNQHHMFHTSYGLDITSVHHRRTSKGLDPRNLKSPYRSSSFRCMGVPVIHQRCFACRRNASSVAAAALPSTIWASSKHILHHKTLVRRVGTTGYLWNKQQNNVINNTVMPWRRNLKHRKEHTGCSEK